MLLFAFIFQFNIMVSSVDSNFHIKSHSSVSQYVFWLIFQSFLHCCSLASYLRMRLTTFSHQFAFYFYLIPSSQTFPILYSPFVTAFWLLQLSKKRFKWHLTTHANLLLPPLSIVTVIWTQIIESSNGLNNDLPQNPNNRFLFFCIE